MNKADLVDRIAGACSISKARRRPRSIPPWTASLLPFAKVTGCLDWIRHVLRLAAQGRNGRNRRRVPPSRSPPVESPNSLPGTNSRKLSTKVSRDPRFLGNEPDGRVVGPAVLYFRSQVLGVRSHCSDAKVSLRPWTDTALLNPPNSCRI